VPNPQQREISRSERTAVNEQPAPEATDPKGTRGKGKGSKLLLEM
jgi:hypothetical protein